MRLFKSLYDSNISWNYPEDFSDHMFDFHFKLDQQRFDRKIKLKLTVMIYKTFHCSFISCRLDCNASWVLRT